MSRVGSLEEEEEAASSWGITMSGSDSENDREKAKRRERIANAQYGVGYGKPPEAGKFVAGNQVAKGRRRPSVTDRHSFAERIGKMKRRLIIDGTPVVLTNDEALDWKAFQNAFTGGPREMALWHKLRDKAEKRHQGSAGMVDHGAEVRRRLELMHERQQEFKEQAAEQPSPSDIDPAREG
ncbi:hypothetical protein [uncultured Enterovirga sp.]|uniref:hypothetical protein n=1 Tax=uncultured Enterovirga sp. TaxID=2026352 RepID=UPI0035C9C255